MLVLVGLVLLLLVVIDCLSYSIFWPCWVYKHNTVWYSTTPSWCKWSYSIVNGLVKGLLRGC